MTRAEKIRATKNDDELVEQIIKIKCSFCRASILDKYGKFCCLYANVEICKRVLMKFLEQEVEE